MTTVGQFLDPHADRLLIRAALAPLLQDALLPAWVVVVIVGRELLIPGRGPSAHNDGLTLGREVGTVMFEHILLAVDGSEYSAQAIKLAGALARQCGAEVVVVHVHEHDIGRAASNPVETPAEAYALVDGVMAELRGMGVEASGDVQGARTGHAARALVEAASAHNSDLVVMGSRGLGDLQGILLGSVTHKLIQLAKTPVLVAR